MSPVDGRIQILHVPDCPLVERLARELEECLLETGVVEQVERLVGAFPSPTLVIDGYDVATGRPVVHGHRCRLDLPSKGQVRAALRRRQP